MRIEDIKFRGQSINSDKWFYGDLSHGSVNNLVDGMWVRFGTIGQFTGLTDSNGQEIYEGDILEVQGNVSHKWLKFEVIWNEANASFMLKGCTDKTDMSPLVSGKEFEKATNLKIVVCGNIYENNKL